MTMSSADDSVSSWLWSSPRVVELTSLCASNGFVRSLATGTLPRPSFQGYVAQDKFFLEAFSRAYATAAAKCAAANDVRSAAEFEELVAGVREELSLHAGYAEQWQVDLRNVTPTAECAAYVNFLLSVSEAEDVATCAAAMVPCMRLYAALGQRIAAQQRRHAQPGATQDGGGGLDVGGGLDAGAYQSWVDTYASDDFEALAAKLEGMLDRLAAMPSAPGRALLHERYVRAMELELAFFNAWA